MLFATFYIIANIFQSYELWLLYRCFFGKSKRGAGKWRAETEKIASREAAGEKKQGKERKICAIFCKNVQKVLDGWT